MAANAAAAEDALGLPAETLSDPWGNAYLYAPRPSGHHSFTLYSLGADGQPGGEGHDADIGQLPAQ